MATISDVVIVTRRTFENIRRQKGLEPRLERYVKAIARLKWSSVRCGLHLKGKKPVLALGVFRPSAKRNIEELISLWRGMALHAP